MKERKWMNVKITAHKMREAGEEANTRQGEWRRITAIYVVQQIITEFIQYIMRMLLNQDKLRH